MRVIGYIFLLLLALYFTVIKPYLLAKRVRLEIEGLGLSLKDGITIESLLFQLSTKYNTFHLSLKGVSLHPWHFQAEELSFIEVSTAPPSDRPFDYDFTALVKLAERLNLKIKELYISKNNILQKESLTLFVAPLELTAGRFFSEGWTQVYWISGKDYHQLGVFLRDARLMNGELHINRAQVRGAQYEFELIGSWKGKRGSFQAWGRILPVESKHFRFESRPMSLKGNIEYTSVRVHFEGSANLDLKERKSYTDIRLKGEYLWEWRKKNLLKLQLQHGSTFAKLDYSLKDGLLTGDFSDFVVDEKLIHIERKVRSVVDGSLNVDLRKKFLSLFARSSLLEVDQHLLSNASLTLHLDYREKPRGSLEFFSFQPFQLSYKGTFLDKNITGDALLTGYSIKEEDITLQLSYQGLVAYQNGLLQLKGSGIVSNITYKDLSLGSGNYTFNLEGNAYSGELSGEGFSLKGNGSLKERSFYGKLLINGKNLSYREVNLKSLAGAVDINLKGKRIFADGNLSGYLSVEKLSSWADVSFELIRSEQGLSGSFKGNTRETKLLGFSYKSGSFSGKLEGETINFFFDLKDGLKGRGYYSLKESSYRAEGSVRQVFKELSLASSYSVEGAGKDLKLSLSGTGLYKNLSFPLEAQLEVKENKVEGKLKGFTIRDNLLNLKIQGIELYGSREEGNIKVGPVALMLGGEPFGKIEFEKGSYKDGSFHIEGRVSGVMDGNIVVDYQKGLRVLSEGLLNLEELSTLIRSRMLADLEGGVSYTLSYTDNTFLFLGRSEKIAVRSRYLATPLHGKVELKLKDEDFSGSLQLQGERRASVVAYLEGDLKSGKVFFKIHSLPVLYRGEDIRANLTLFGNGNMDSDYRRLNIAGRFYTSGFVNLQRSPKKKTAPPEEYKRVNLDLSVSSSEPIKVNLPEGFVYTDIVANIKGNLYEPNYNLKANLKGGRLRYFDRDFYVSKGEVSFTRRESSLDLTMTTSAPEYTIILELKGNPQYPKVMVRSEPPRDSREVITTLVLGSSKGESLIPVGGAIVSQIPQLSGLIESAKGITGTDVKIQVYPSVSPSGEAGVNVGISKEITERIFVEYRHSSHKDPKETYTAGEIKLTPNTSIGGRLYSDRTQEVRIRFRKKFDF